MIWARRKEGVRAEFTIDDALDKLYNGDYSKDTWAGMLGTGYKDEEEAREIVKRVFKTFMMITIVEMIKYDLGLTFYYKKALSRVLKTKYAAIRIAEKASGAFALINNQREAAIIFHSNSYSEPIQSPPVVKLEYQLFRFMKTHMRKTGMTYVHTY